MYILYFFFFFFPHLHDLHFLPHYYFFEYITFTLDDSDLGTPI